MPLGACLLFSQTQGGYIRDAEHRCSNILIIDRAILVGLIQPPCQCHTFGQRNRGQLYGVGNITNGKNCRIIGLVFFIHINEALLVQLDCSVFQPQSIQLGASTGGVQHQIRFDLVAAFQFDMQAAVFLLVDSCHVGIELQVHALVLHGDHHVVAQALIKAPQELFAPVQQAGLAAQAVEDAGKFHRNVTTAHDNAAFGQMLQVKHLIGADYMFTPRKLRNEGPAAGGNQDAFSAVGFVINGNGVGIEQPGSTIDQSDAGAGQQVVIDAIESGDFGVLVFHQTLPAECGVGLIPAVSLGILEVFSKMRRISEQLLRHTADVNAGATQV